MNSPIPVFKITSPEPPKVVKLLGKEVEVYNGFFMKLKGDYYVPVTVFFDLVGSVGWTREHDEIVRVLDSLIMDYKTPQNIHFVGFTIEPLYADVFLYGFLMQMLGFLEEYERAMSKRGAFKTLVKGRYNPMKILKEYFKHGIVVKRMWYEKGVEPKDYFKLLGLLHLHHPYRTNRAKIIELPVHVHGFDEFKALIPVFLNTEWVVNSVDEIKFITTALSLMHMFSPEEFSRAVMNVFYFEPVIKESKRVLKEGKVCVTTKVQHPEWISLSMCADNSVNMVKYY